MELRKAAGDWLELDNLGVGEKLWEGEGTEAGRGGGGGGSGKESATKKVDVGLKAGGGGGGGGGEGDQGYSSSGANVWEKMGTDVLPNCFSEAVGDIGDGRLDVEEPGDGVT